MQLNVFFLLCWCLFDGNFTCHVACFSIISRYEINYNHHVVSNNLNSLSALSRPGADIEQETDEETPQPQVVGDKIIYRGKVNEIDYCIAPSDVSLSRVSGKIITTKSGDVTVNDDVDDKSAASPKTMSLTKALNNACNRAVRRILLAKSWPSEEAFNLSLRLAANAEKKQQQLSSSYEDTKKQDSKVCPVPRPILNMLKTSSKSSSNSDTITSPSSKSGVSGMASSTGSFKKTRTNEEYVKDQVNAFRNRYGKISGYNDAEALLESILSLATTGEESIRVNEVMESDNYNQSYKRIMSVLKSAGVVFEETESGAPKLRIAKKLQNQNFCLSIADTLATRKNNNALITSNYTSGRMNEKNESDTHDVENNLANNTTIERPPAKSGSKKLESKKGNRLIFWTNKVPSSIDPAADNNVDLFSDEKSMTQQLNAFSNIVSRVLLFGDDQELLIVSETLASNKKCFVDRWYQDTGPIPKIIENESRPGVQYLDALICLLRLAYKDGVVTSLEPLTVLTKSYNNSYERLVAMLVETGSGYIRPEETSDVMAMPKPRTALEQLGRIALWESAFRSKDDKNGYTPEDLEGDWEVTEVFNGKQIGISKITFMQNGEVMVQPPLQGLRWRLDPGPTHLDTCTFQVLSDDGTVLQYRGFIDRGARLEARFSGRPTNIRGSVVFQMRDAGNYWKVNVPSNYLEGATRFEMTKKSKKIR